MPATPDLQPLFPLPNVVLFPKGILPLHIFEPRYRKMMADALKGGQTICMALLKPGWEADYHGSPEVYRVACVGRVVQHEELEGGRYNVTLHGEAKVAIEGFDSDRPYRVARVRPLHEERSWADSRDVDEDVAELLALFRRVRPGPVSPVEPVGPIGPIEDSAAFDLAQLFGGNVSPERVVNTVAMNVNVEPRVKQELLELDSLGARCRAIVRYLRDSAATQDLLDRVRHLYPADRRRN
jgi:Lon protease-like protein